MSFVKLIFVFLMSLILGGCITTNSVPYKASTGNVVAIKNAFKDDERLITTGKFEMSPGVDDAPNCRLNGPIRVSPGKSMAEYIKDAFVEELFLAGVYDASSKHVINAEIQEAKFSSVAPAKWEITMFVSSTNFAGYAVSVDYGFKTSWDAYSACQNVADAFGPAVQALLSELVSHPEFTKLAE